MQETKEISPYKKGLRNKIITTSMEAFARNGIRHVKMDDVAKDLGISKRTLYEIFDKKEDLLYEGVKYYLGERRTQMELKAQQCKNVMEIILQAYKLKVEEFRPSSLLLPSICSISLSVSLYCLAMLATVLSSACCSWQYSVSSRALSLSSLVSGFSGAFLTAFFLLVAVFLGGAFSGVFSAILPLPPF